MNFSLGQKRFTNLQVQRNALVGLCCCLLVIASGQVFLLMFKHERIIIMPPELRQTYWVEGNRFAPSYLEEMALYFCHLLLDLTEANIIPQGEILLRYINSSAYGKFKTKLLADEKRLKKEQLSLHFAPQQVQVFAKALSVEVSGDLLSYVESRKTSQIRETYRLIFKQHAGRLFLDDFQVVKSERSERE